MKETKDATNRWRDKPRSLIEKKNEYCDKDYYPKHARQITHGIFSHSVRTEKFRVSMETQEGSDWQRRS